MLLLPAAVAACSFAGAGRSAARGAALGLQDRRDTLALVAGRVMDTLAGRITHNLRDSLGQELVRVAAQVTDTAAATLQVRTRQMEDQLARFVAGELRDSTGRLVASLAGIARDSLQRAFRAWTRQFAADAQGRLVPVVGTLADTTLHHALTTLDASLRGPLRATILDLVSVAADSVRNKAERTSTSVMDRVRALGAQILVPVGLVLVAAAAFTYWQFRKRQKMLEVIATEIRNEGSDELKVRIKARAQQNRVEKDLNDFLVKRNLV